MRRLTLSAKLLLSVVLSPALITASMYISDAGHEYIGGAGVAYGICWALVGLIGGPLLVSENGFVSAKYRASLRKSEQEVKRLEGELLHERALREKFQVALTDGVAK